MISGKNGIRLGAYALTTAVAATSAQAVDTLKLAIGVRETATTAAIGENGSTLGTGGNSQIEGINWTLAQAATLTADNTWQKFTFTFGTDPVTSAFGVGDGILNSPNRKGTLEHILVRNSSPTTSEIKLYIDDIVLQVNNSLAGTPLGTYILSDFETPAAGTNQYMFDHPLLSGTSAGFLAASPDVTQVVDSSVTDPHGGNQSEFVNFKFNAPSTAQYLRLTTSNAPGGLPNPAIDYADGNVLTFWAKAFIAPPTMFWNVWTGGDWDNGANWSNSPAEPIPGAAITIGSDPNGGGDTARFLTPATGTPQPQTINGGGDKYLNQLLIDNVQPYTFTGSSFIMTSTASPPRSGTATIATVNGSHTISVNDVFLNSSLNLSVGGAGNTLTINPAISLLPTINPVTDHPQIIITKSGDGAVVVNDVNYGYLVVAGGTFTVNPGKALNLVFNESAATPPVTAATARQAIFIQPGATLNLTNTSPDLKYRYTDTTTGDANGDQSTFGMASILNDGTLNMSGGTLDTTRITISAARGNLNLSNGATVNANYLAQHIVSINNSTITIRPNGGTGHLGGTSSVEGLVISGTGKLELNDNDFAFIAGAPSNATIRGYLASGYAGGAWTGNGIRAAAAAADAQHRTALGYASAAQLFGVGNTGSISGQGLAADGAIIKYTYYGDATLDGKVDRDDYARIDRGMAMGLSDWVDGDFDYNGLINGADYQLIDRVFIQQGGVLSPGELASREAQFGDGYVSSLLASVPEPGSIGVIGLAGMALGARRRRV